MSEQPSVEAPESASGTPVPAQGEVVVPQSSTADIAPGDEEATDVDVTNADATDSEAVDEPEAVTDTENDAPEMDEPDNEDESSDRPARKPLRERLEEEGDVAADYLEELLDIVDLDGDIDIDVENGRASVSIIADPVSTRSLRRLVGTDGEVLEALQELTRLAVQARTGERSRLMLDIAGHRAGRRTELEGVAARAIQECQETGEPIRLEPMSPFERKVVHDTVAAAGLRSESEGEEPQRRVVVLPAAGE
jgi:spoIIIJ-associated protein